jgi:hypothetical protein
MILDTLIPSTVAGLGSSTYVSSASLVSTVEGLGSSTYVSSGSLASTTNGIMNINANGLYGSICNIVYYKDPLTKRQIVLNYNILSQNNPPILADT